MRFPSKLTPFAAAALLALPAAVHAQAVTVTEAKPGLLKEARVQPAEAQKAALGHVPNATVTKAEIENEGKKLIYSYDLTVPGKPGITEVHVDANTGKVLSTKHEMSKTETAAKPMTAATPAKPASASMTKPATTTAPAKKP
jgi:Zn-dependent metalloprotease